MNIKNSISKKSIVIFGGSGQLGEVLFTNYNRDRYDVINVSLKKDLKVKGVVNIHGDITNRIDLIKIKYKLLSLLDKVDVLILGSMFIYHKNILSLSRSELAFEFNVNVFSQIEIIKLVLDSFWRREGEGLSRRQCIYISSAASLGITERKDLESYSVEKSCLNMVARYLEKELKAYYVTSQVYLPGSLLHTPVAEGLHNAFWDDIERAGEEALKERVF